MSHIALQNIATDLFVAAELNGSKNLIANRQERKEFEVFELFDVDRAKGHVAFKAANGYFVGVRRDLRLPNGGVISFGSMLFAIYGGISLETTFEQKTVSLAPMGGHPEVAFRSIFNKNFVTADYDSGGILRANRGEIREWETFYYHELGGSFDFQKQARLEPQDIVAEGENICD